MISQNDVHPDHTPTGEKGLNARKTGGPGFALHFYLNLVVNSSAVFRSPYWASIKPVGHPGRFGLLKDEIKYE